MKEYLSPQELAEVIEEVIEYENPSGGAEHTWFLCPKCYNWVNSYHWFSDEIELTSVKYRLVGEFETEEVSRHLLDCEDMSSSHDGCPAFKSWRDYAFPDTASNIRDHLVSISVDSDGVHINYPSGYQRGNHGEEYDSVIEETINELRKYGFWSDVEMRL